jgi:hypothetical protein
MALFLFFPFVCGRFVPGTRNAAVEQINKGLNDWLPGKTKIDLF